MKTIFSIAVLFMAFNMASAQVTQEWAARYNGKGDSTDIAKTMAIDGSGNVYVTGYSYDLLSDINYVTIKYNSSGIQEWEQRYNGPANDYDEAKSIAVDGAGNVYVTGRSQGIGTYWDYATIKYNSVGVQQWVQRYNDSENSDEAYSILVDSSGNVYVTGFSGNGPTTTDYVTIKYNSSGDLLWLKRYDGTGNGGDYPNSMAIDGSGNVYVTGYSLGTEGNFDFATIMYNSFGDSVWVKRYNDSENSWDYAHSIVVDGSSNVYVTGASQESGLIWEYTTVKYNSSGSQQWVQKYNDFNSEVNIASSIAVDGSGNVYVTGESQNNESGSNYATVKYNSSGVQQWAQLYDGPGSSYDYAASIAVDSFGNVYVTGQSRGSQTDDYATIKYNSSGVQQWMQRYDGPSNDFDRASSIAVDGTGNVYVTGVSTGLETDEDFVTIKYSQSTNISQVSSIVPEGFNLSQNYPNPFNPSTTFEFGIPKSGFVSLKIYNMLGKEVGAVVNSELNPGTYKYEFDASDLASGVYLYKLSSGNFSETKQMILIK